jgi:hypothetical protein
MSVQEDDMGKLTLDDAMLDDPRVAKAGALGFAVHVAGLLWCSRNNTNAIPWERVACLLDLSGVSIDNANPAAVAGGPRSMGGQDGGDPHEIARHLVDVGLWEEIPVERVVHAGTPAEKTETFVDSFLILDAPVQSDRPVPIHRADDDGSNEQRH